jgi:hypothetical protein
MFIKLVMTTVWRRLSESNIFIYLVFFLAAIYLGFVACSIHEGIFYAGDQGIKSLVVKQIAEGYGFKYLHLPQPAWVQDIWRAGFTPLRAPSFYDSPNGYIIVFPPAFQVMSAWLYAKWGTVGLYIIPMLSTVVLLLWFVFLLKRCGVKPIMVALALFLLVFCSPLALYGVMFWEHLPAVLLLFAGLAFIVRPPQRVWGAVVLGVISGLAVFLRPEALVMDFLYGMAAIALWVRERRDRRLIAFLAGVALPVLAFFVFNFAEYGSVLGIHGRQVFTDQNPDTRMTLHHGLENLWANNHISTSHFVFVLLLIPLIIRIMTKGIADPRPVLLAGIVVVFSLATPWVLPNDGIVQWGARYLLAIIPVTLVALFLAERQWSLFEGNHIPLWLLCLIVLGIGYGFYDNTHGGGYKEVRWRYSQRLTDTYRLIGSQPGNVVIVSRHWMINDFAWLFDKEYFFAASNNDSLSRLLPLLKKNGVHQYIFVYDPRVPNIWMKKDYAAKVYTIK